MPLSPGTHFGPYEIVSLLGAGGMGEVYRARDTKLGRDVAIKVLPESLACDPERLARFEREARVLASLNHPHIAQIYGVEESGNVRALVLELVEGETLAQRVGGLGAQSFRLHESLAIAKQIADALDAAHERGIVHRDLKPANIAIKPDGTVKVLDFGLAKSEGSGVERDLTNSPTAMRPTVQGVLLGTAPYMSPEQARGRAVDKRTDIWAFGCVLYEMFVGQRAFAGETSSDTVAAILERAPDWSKLPENTPAPIRRLLLRCLEKDPKQRLRDIADARIELDAPESDTTPSVARTTARERVAWALAAALCLCVAMLLWVWRRSPSPIDVIAQQPIMRFDLDLGPGTPDGATGANFALSSDGRRLAFVTPGTDGTTTHLFVRRLDQSGASEVTDTSDASAPFFSPDGQWIGFFAGGKLKKVSADGGAVTTICDAPTGRGASWGEDGNIVVAPDLQTPLLKIPASGGGVLRPLTEFSAGEISHRWPQVLPGGKAVLFTALTAPNFAAFDEASIQVVSLPSGTHKTLHQGGSYGRYLPSGHLMYVRNGTVFAAPFDADRLETRGDFVPVLEGVAYVPTGGSAQVDASATGTLLYEPGTTPTWTLQWLQASGRFESLLSKPGSYVTPRLSPDGNRLVYRLSEGSKTDLWVYDWRRGTNTRLTTDATIHNSPAWSADGQYIAYQAEGGVFWIAADGGGKPRLLLEAKNTPFPESFSADGRWLAFSASNPRSGDLDIWTVPLTGGDDALQAGKPVVFAHTPGNERDAAFSPDGRWLAYSSSESGDYQVYVRAFSGTLVEGAAKWQISNSGGSNPRWSRNGGELFYGVNNHIMAVTYSTHDAVFVADKPRVWSERQVMTSPMPTFDVSPDAQRFAVLTVATGSESPDTRHHVTLVLNFFDELRRVASVRKPH